MPAGRVRTTSGALTAFTDGGPFVYTPLASGGLRVEHMRGYLEGAGKPLTIVELTTKDRILAARLVPALPSQCSTYLIARAAFHFAAEGHLGEVDAVRFEGADIARKDIELLASTDTLPTRATQLSVRAAPARGPCPLDRLATWQRAPTSVPRERVYGIIRTALETGHSSLEPRVDIQLGMHSTARSTRDESANNATGRVIQGTVRGQRMEGRLFHEPWMDHDDGKATTLLSWIADRATIDDVRGGSLASHVDPAWARRVAYALARARGKTIAYPAIDPIAVYVDPSPHWLDGNTRRPRVWVHLPTRAYVFGQDGSGARASIAVCRHLSSIFTPPGAQSALRAASLQWSAALAGHPAWQGWAPPRVYVDDSTPASRAWRAHGIFAPSIRQARLMLSIPQLAGSRGVVSLCYIRGHVMCCVLVVQSAPLRATLLVRNSWAGDPAVWDALNAHPGDAPIPLTIEHVHAPDAHYTQTAGEGSCAFHSIMFATYLLDTAAGAVQSGSLDEIRAVLLTRPPPRYALIARTILVHHTRDDNEGDLGPFAETRTRAQHDAAADEGELPVIARVPGIHGALATFRFADPELARRALHVRVDAIIDAYSNVLLVASGESVRRPMAPRCIAFARECIHRIFPGPNVTGPILRVAAAPFAMGPAPFAPKRPRAP
jgi:hypothetical protein